MGQQSKVATPGEDIAASEEFSAGEGAYELDGRIIATVAGRVVLDKGTMVASVRAANPPRFFAPGDIVLGEVSEVRGTMVNLQSVVPEAGGRKPAGGDAGTIHISKVSEGRTDDLREMFRLGDVVRAKVVQARPSLQLTTAGADFGVVKALCMRCRAPMALAKGELRCEGCERTERRKMAKGYSSPKFFEG
jgi:exosome complex component CSL4